MKLGKYFNLKEFLRSQEAARMGKTLSTPPSDVLNELTRLVILILDPLREEVKSPIIVSSGWRPIWLNNRIKGSTNSDHIYGRAADLNVVGMTDEDVCLKVAEMKLPIKQCILEYPPQGWVHLSIAETGHEPRQQFLTATNTSGKTNYLPGIHA